MVNIILNISGLLLIIVTWAFIVLPYFLIEKKIRPDTISAAVINKKYGKVINTALFTSGFLQLVFIYFLLGKYKISPFPCALVYLFGAIFLILASIFTVKYKILHKILGVMHFSLISIGALYFSIIVSFQNQWVGYIASFNIVILMLGMFFFASRKKYLYSELWSFLFSSLWAIIWYLN